MVPIEGKVPDLIFMVEGKVHGQTFMTLGTGLSVKGLTPTGQNVVKVAQSNGRAEIPNN